ncbi:MAG: metallopeptidase [Luteolibacter sp.]
MLKSLTFPCLLAAGLVAAVANTAKEEPKKVGWVETVQLDMHGWTVHAETSLVSGEHKEMGQRALSMLANHLERITILIEGERLEKLRKMEIFVEHGHPELRAMQYHPSVDWLTERGYDPRLAKKVHITKADQLISRDQLLKHPAVILHELAHAYHDQVLGFDHPGILKAYETAMEAGIYEKSLLYTGDIVRHYATTDHKEYFAEATEAYLYHNDFYPFVRAELFQHDPKAFALMAEIWGEAN